MNGTVYHFRSCQKTTENTTTIHRMKSLLKDELKLDPDVVLADDEALIGGDHDLDSLDVLLIISSVEKRVRHQDRE